MEFLGIRSIKVMFCVLLVSGATMARGQDVVYSEYEKFDYREDESS